MPEEFLDLPEVPASGEDLGGGRVAKTMRINAIKAGNTGMLENDFGNTCTRQGFKGR